MFRHLQWQEPRSSSTLCISYDGEAVCSERKPCTYICRVNGCPWGCIAYIQIQMDIKALLRELSQPHPFCCALDIVSKPRIWNQGTEATSLKSHPTFQLMGSGRTPNPPNSSSLNAVATPVLKHSIPPAPTTRKTWETRAKASPDFGGSGGFTGHMT